MSASDKFLLVIGCMLYVICPLDFDFIPLLGWIDDFLFMGYTAYKVLT